MRWLILLLVCSTAHADLTLAVGAGKGVFGSPGTPFERVGALGYEYHIGDFFFRPETIYWEDLAGNGARSSFLWTAKAGVQTIVGGGFEAHMAIGPSYLQNPDTVLGGNYQFSPEMGLCFNDGKNAECVAWYHESSGPFYAVNHGRDFFMFEWRILGI